MDNYQQFIHKSRYARWLPEEKRRETWEETVKRLIDFFRTDSRTNKLSPRVYDELETAIINLDVMPSMRALMVAGPALERNNLAAFNCSYIAVDDVRAFDEILYVLMNGTGVGFSVEAEDVSKLPKVPKTLDSTDSVIVVEDSKEGWAQAYRILLQYLYGGMLPNIDTHKVRKAGERLKTFGGRASGPQPLVDLFNFTTDIFQNARGRKLTSLECHDIVCKIAEIVVVGGVRRSALISLSDLTDNAMRYAKTGNWGGNEPQRGLANNSAVYTQRPDIGTFMEEWTALYRSGNGERGIFNRDASQRQASMSGRRKTDFNFGTNPCSEIILRSMEMCNLTEVIARSDDTEESLREKVVLATILGTLQSCLTDFKYVRDEWKRNTEEERLLGVSITGIMDCPLLNDDDDGDLEERLTYLKNQAIDTNINYAEQLDIEPSVAITCVKPSGTVSQLVDSASGIHTRHSKYYIRTVRADNKDPMTQFMKDSGVSNEPCVYKPETTTIFSFPIESPDGSIYRDDRTAIEQLEHWLVFQRYWCEHKPSITVSVKEHEWLDVGAWVWDNFDEVSGVSFLPHDGAKYPQMPYQEVDKETYDAAVATSVGDINWEELAKYEDEDNTASSQTLACSGSACEIVDIGDV